MRGARQVPSSQRLENGRRRVCPLTNQELGRCQDHLRLNQEPEAAISLERECGLTKMIAERDIAIGLVYLRIENPASIGRNRQAAIHGASVATIILRICRVEESK